MSSTNVNPKLRAAIKPRHLVDAVSENWQQMARVSDQVTELLDDAASYMNAYGTKKQKTFSKKISVTNTNIKGVHKTLQEVLEALKNNQTIDWKVNWNEFKTFLKAVEQDFSG